MDDDLSVLHVIVVSHPSRDLRPGILVSGVDVDFAPEVVVQQDQLKVGIFFEDLDAFLGRAAEEHVSPKSVQSLLKLSDSFLVVLKNQNFHF